MLPRAILAAYLYHFLGVLNPVYQELAPTLINSPLLNVCSVLLNLVFAESSPLLGSASMSYQGPATLSLGLADPVCPQLGYVVTALIIDLMDKNGEERDA